MTAPCLSYPVGTRHQRVAALAIDRIVAIALAFSATLFLFAFAATHPCSAQEEYSRPVTAAPQADDIGGGYQVPAVQRVAPRSVMWYLVDLILLSVGLIAAGLVAHRWRRRWMAVTITLLSLAYFGFYRQGCVCPIGSTQNVAAALVDSTITIPFVVLAFFLLPLFAALIAGRVFCGGLCPLGAIQDIVLLRPIQLPHAVDRWGSLIRYVYLFAAIWFATRPVASRDFIICRFDPFVGFFRLSGSSAMFAVGGLLLVVGTVIGRPYCRFLCPYGGLLSLVSRFAWYPVSITPDEELDCGLCAESCPFGAVRNLRADRATCLACTRCFAHCPRQQYRWGEIELVEIEHLQQKMQPVAKPKETVA